jgi:cell division protein ZapA
MSDQPNSVQVEIFGQTYAVRAGEDRGYVERLAAHVDAQMREIGRSAGAVDSLRVAVLAALNIADETFRLREEVRAMRERVTRLADTLGSVDEGFKKA